ncbi:hypothetical protein PGT21_004621 [Puccinia graminis f. sp. tritici]|uniref:Uncharacterized protein n=1 Tax=Puccinia graminis f. sp. tritici TaxID=56615 RepID=A0A5B0QTC5_PUCGR|nr:hypothetical protein PGT21_004621 [Puccinia graminis f. sp. tritici]
MLWTDHAAVIDHSQFANATEPDDCTGLNRSSLLDRLSSPIAVALTNRNLLSEPFDKSATIDIADNQNTRPQLETNKEANRTAQ